MYISHFFKCFSFQQLSNSDFLSLAPHARSLVLQLKTPGSESLVVGPNAVARYLAGLHEDSMLGSTDFQEANVDQWLEFCWHELEVVCGACLFPPRAGEPAFDKDMVAAMASKDAIAALTVMNSTLLNFTYLVGDTLTLADASAVASLSQVIMKVPKLLQGFQFNKSLPCLMRWFLTCLHNPKISIVLGSDVLKQFNIIASTPAVVSAAVVSGKSCTPAEAKVKSKASGSSSLSSAAKFVYKNEVEGTPELKFKYTLK